MTTTIEAIYENGTLRLMEPIPLAEGTRVEVIVIANEPPSQERNPAEILAGIAALPTVTGGREFTARDHDKILYGDKDTR